MNRRTACLGVATLSLTAGIVLAAGVTSANGALPVPLMVIANHLTLDHLGHNLLTTNRQSLLALDRNPLTTASFAAGTLHDALLDPSARDVMKDLVACALAPKQRVQWTPPASEGAWAPTPEERAARAQPDSPLSYSGSIGLCPEWADPLWPTRDKAHNAMRASCQELVSACLLAKNNAFGERVDISARGRMLSDKAGQGRAIPVDATEKADYPWREGAFFGNLFNPSALNTDFEVTLVAGKVTRPTLTPAHLDDMIYKEAFVCHPEEHAAGPRYDEVTYMQRRVCARSTGGGQPGCLAKHVGACGSYAAGGSQQMGQENVCAGEPVDGTYTGPCTGNAGDAKRWMHPVTVYLREPCDVFGSKKCNALNDNGSSPVLVRKPSGPQPANPNLRVPQGDPPPTQALPAQRKVVQPPPGGRRRREAAAPRPHGRRRARKRPRGACAPRPAAAISAVQ
ncbi:hypothetical protein [Sorangium sp. So ce1000]|uniref:hypothetical protein n=1 Tax=Sorangium sp. So ce1000 TaxID=3133325 RepID=UPI003F616DDC